jgi:hypothetical protein
VPLEGASVACTLPCGRDASQVIGTHARSRTCENSYVEKLAGKYA